MATEASIREQLPTDAEALVCWSCGTAIAANDHFCATCGKVQRPQSVDHFCFFGLPRKLKIDTGRLEKDFYRLSRKLHPDVYSRATAEEQEWSLEKSSQLNDAYRALRDPVARTQYLLKLEGVQLEEQSKAATDRARESGEEKKQVVPPDLLEEVFELNMQLQELKMSSEAKDPEVVAQLEAAKKNFEARLGAMRSELESYWEEWDRVIESGADQSNSARIATRDKMVALLNRRSYIRNLVRDVNEALAS